MVTICIGSGTINLIKMKTVMFGVFAQLSVLLACTSCNKPYYYSVGVKNHSASLIITEPIRIYDGSNGVVDMGYAYPGFGYSMGLFFAKPFTNIIISWSNTVSKERHSVPVEVNLPGKFTGKQGSFIDFEVSPDEKTVKVVYGIIENRNGESHIIRINDKGELVK